MDVQLKWMNFILLIHSRYSLSFVSPRVPLDYPNNWNLSRDEKEIYSLHSLRKLQLLTSEK